MTFFAAMRHMLIDSRGTLPLNLLHLLKALVMEQIFPCLDSLFFQWFLMNRINRLFLVRNFSRDILQTCTWCFNSGTDIVGFRYLRKQSRIFFTLLHLYQGQSYFPFLSLIPIIKKRGGRTQFCLRQIISKTIIVSSEWIPKTIPHFTYVIRHACHLHMFVYEKISHEEWYKIHV